jgi:hypothetical protein
VFEGVMNEKTNETKIKLEQRKETKW